MWEHDGDLVVTAVTSSFHFESLSLERNKGKTEKNAAPRDPRGFKPNRLSVCWIQTYSPWDHLDDWTKRCETHAFTQQSISVWTWPAKPGREAVGADAANWADRTGCPSSFSTPATSSPPALAVGSHCGAGWAFPYQWQDMMGQMKINGKPGCQCGRWRLLGAAAVWWAEGEEARGESAVEFERMEPVVHPSTPDWRRCRFPLDDSWFDVGKSQNSSSDAEIFILCHLQISMGSLRRTTKSWIHWTYLWTILNMIL